MNNVPCSKGAQDIDQSTLDLASRVMPMMIMISMILSCSLHETKNERLFDEVDKEKKSTCSVHVKKLRILVPCEIVLRVLYS